MPEPSRAVARYDGPRSTEELARYSALLAVNSTPDGRAWRNEALPATFRGNPAAVAFAVEYAKALDVSPVTAIIGIHIVDGKPTASAGLVSALVRRAGHKIRTSITGTVAAGDVVAVTSIWRSDDPDFEYRSEWDLERAVRAGLCTTVLDPNTGKWSVSALGRSGKPGAWQTYTEGMLKARSITECARDAAEDAILGVHYTPEELGVEVDETGEPVYTVTTVPEQQQTAPPVERVESTTTVHRDPEPAPSTPEATADPKAGDDAELADYCRSWILKARTRDDLATGWKGTDGLSTELAGRLECGDEAGALTTVLELFRRQTAAVDAENPLVDLWGGDDEPGGGTPAEPSGDDPAGPEVGVQGVEGDNPVQAAQRGVGAKLERERVERIEHRDNGGPAPSSGPPVDPAAVRPSTPNRDDLNRIMNGLTPEQVDDVVSWCRLNGANPNDGEDACSTIVEAIATGEAFSNRTKPEDPLELVGRILGGEVISSEPTTPAEQHARELDERHAEAREATPAHRGRVPAGTGHSAFQQARENARTSTRKATDS